MARDCRDRFSSVPSAMSYTLIFLSGDYPLTEFTPLGKLVNFFMIIVAQAVVAIPTAITISSFTDLVGKTRKKADQQGAVGDASSDSLPEPVHPILPPRAESHGFFRGLVRNAHHFLNGDQDNVDSAGPKRPG